MDVTPSSSISPFRVTMEGRLFPLQKLPLRKRGRGQSPRSGERDHPVVNVLGTVPVPAPESVVVAQDGWLDDDRPKRLGRSRGPGWRGQDGDDTADRRGSCWLGLLGLWRGRRCHLAGVQALWIYTWNRRPLCRHKGHGHTKELVHVENAGGVKGDRLWCVSRVDPHVDQVAVDRPLHATLLCLVDVVRGLGILIVAPTPALRSPLLATADSGL
mmetsp:Transcript_106994/g.271631  ORF Transcript_106994/g.271631 Transcript_106994/m.271631 type:complete len:214 (+) Transcript_106994:578-1219(+)